MASEGDRQEQRDRLGNDPLETPPLDQLEEENPTESPASDSEADGGDREKDRERASSSMEPPRSVGKSTEDLTVAGSENRPDDQGVQRER
jgi:hypothetical protein